MRTALKLVKKMPKKEFSLDFVSLIADAGDDEIAIACIELMCDLAKMVKVIQQQNAEKIAS